MTKLIRAEEKLAREFLTKIINKRNPVQLCLLIEKGEPKPVFLTGDGYADGNLVFDTACCPECYFVLTDEFDCYSEYEPYCPHCGQRLDWNICEEDSESLCNDKEKNE